MGAAVKAVANRVEVVVVLAAEADVEGLEVVQADPAAVVARSPAQSTSQWPRLTAIPLGPSCWTCR